MWLLVASALASPLPVDLAVGTDVPISLGGAVHVGLPARFELAGEVGWMPPAYLDAIDAIGVSAGWYTEPTADLIEAALDSSVLFGGRVRWRPVPKIGWNVGIGWTVAVLGGGLTGGDVLAEATGREAPSTPSVITAHATDHLLRVSTGWRFNLNKHWRLRTELGGAFSVASSVKLEAPETRFDAANAELDALEAEGEAYLKDTLTRYVHTPTLGVSIAYRL